MEEESGTLTPISSSSSTAVDQLSVNNDFSPQKSPLVTPNSSSLKSLDVSRRSPRPRDRRSFSSAQKLPILEPSTSTIRKQFDFILLWILQSITIIYLYVIASKNSVVYYLFGLWYDWHSWPWCAKYMIEWDVSKLHKIPRHVAVILDQRRMKREYDGDDMVQRATELAVWCGCAGIPVVTIYEPTGMVFVISI